MFLDRRSMPALLLCLSASLQPLLLSTGSVDASGEQGIQGQDLIEELAWRATSSAEFEAVGAAMSGAPLDEEMIHAIETNEDFSVLTFYTTQEDVSAFESFSASAPTGVEVKHQLARWSMRDYQDITRLINAHWRPEWGVFEGLSPSPDGLSLGANWSSEPSLDRLLPLDRMRAVTGVWDLADAGPREAYEVSARWNDWAPWNAGGAVRGGGRNCSTGFGIRTAAGHERILTAAHCFALQTEVSDGALEPMGMVSFVSSTHDYEMIAADPSGRAFVGVDEDASPASTRLVNDWSANVIGAQVCAQGANSGQHCGLTIQGVVTDGNGWPQYYTEPVPGLAVVGGDSGGPVATLGSTYVGPRGIIVKGGLERACDSSDWRMNPSSDSLTGCWGRVYYIPINTILSHHSATLVTGNK